MTSVGIPDILSGLSLSRAQRDVQSRLQTVQVELITGERQNKIAATHGDPQRFFALETEITRVESRLPLLELAKARADTSVTALDSIRETVGEFGVQMLTAAVSGDIDTALSASRDAQAILGQTMSALNVNVGGRFVFGGDRADSAPLASMDILMQDVTDAVLGQLTDMSGNPLTVGGVPATPAQQIAGYFGRAFGGESPPTFDVPMERGFSRPGDPANGIYSGGVDPAPSVELARNARLSYGVNADAPEIAEFVMQLSVIAAYGEGAATPADTLAGLETASTGLLGAKEGLTAVEARLGLDQRRIEDAIARNQAEKASLEQARALLVGRDPYEAATELTELENQLQTIYAMTARTSQLSLLNYL